MKPRAFGKLTSFFSDLPLSVKGFVVVAIPVCALLAAMVMLYQFQGQSRRAEAAVVNTFEVRSELRRTLTMLVNAETGIRGFLLT
ncbi:MAG TPA: CHASE3 domain-containing protein, partial [Bryobacteraceae bacterium]